MQVEFLFNLFLCKVLFFDITVNVTLCKISRFLCCKNQTHTVVRPNLKAVFFLDAAEEQNYCNREFKFSEWYNFVAQA